LDINQRPRIFAGSNFKNNLMKANNLRSIIGIGGRIFTVDFIKKDGTSRTMNCRMGVTRHLKGGKASYNAQDKNMLHVFDMQKRQYRTINVSTVTAIRCNGDSFLVMNTTINK
jgi:hypothetical protein